MSHMLLNDLRFLATKINKLETNFKLQIKYLDPLIKEINNRNNATAEQYFQHVDFHATSFKSQFY